MFKDLMILNYAFQKYNKKIKNDKKQKIKGICDSFCISLFYCKFEHFK